MHISLIGVPTDVGANRVGTRMGPAALRVAGIAQSIARYGPVVSDVGDVAGPANPELPPVDGYRHLREVTDWAIAVREAVAAELSSGRLPIVMGGDHSIAIGSLSAVAAHCRAEGKKLRILWVDAHADINTSQLTPTGNIHGMPVACLLGHGPDELTSLSDATPAISPDQIRQLGLRSVDPGEKAFLAECGLEVYDMRFIDEIGMRRAVVRALTGVSDDTHVHLSLDLDFCDPSFAPGVGTPVAGGSTYREASLVMEMLADCGCVGSVDLVELNPALDVHNQTAELAVDLLESLFGKSTLLRVTPTRTR